jgi:hypothetical protein
LVKEYLKYLEWVPMGIKKTIFGMGAYGDKKNPRR